MTQAHQLELEARVGRVEQVLERVLDAVALLRVEVDDMAGQGELAGWAQGEHAARQAGQAGRGGQAPRGEGAGGQHGTGLPPENPQPDSATQSYPSHSPSDEEPNPARPSQQKNTEPGGVPARPLWQSACQAFVAAGRGAGVSSMALRAWAEARPDVRGRVVQRYIERLVAEGVVQEVGRGRTVRGHVVAIYRIAGGLP